METQTYPKNTDRVGFLHLKQHWSPLYSVLVLDMHYQHGPVTVTIIVLTAQPHHKLQCVCRTWKTFTNSTEQIDD